MKSLPSLFCLLASLASVQSLVAQDANSTGAAVRPGALPNLPTDVSTISSDDVVLSMPEEGQRLEAATEQDGTISVDFPEEDVRSVIRSVATLYELNVVIPEELVGTVSLRLHDVTWQQVFEVILEPYNYTFVIEKNIVKIKSLESIVNTPMETRVFIVSFADAKDLKTTIESKVSADKGGRVEYNQRNNALIVTEIPSKMDEIQQIIDQLDKPTNQVMIESKFVEISTRNQENIGLDWSGAFGGSTGITAGPFNREFTSDYTRELGNTGTSTGSRTTTVTSNGTTFTINDNTANSNTNTFADSDSWADTAVFSADAFRVVVGALKSNSDVELVSNPTVVTMNNQPAEILVGQEYPVVETRFNPQTGTYEAGEAEYKNIGIQMMVTPSVNAAGFITLNVEPQVSALDGTVTQLSASYPIISSRRTKSVVTIKDGYTLALGGLIERRESKGNNRVPVLGKVPMLGRLFRSDEGDLDRRNLVIFITAKVLSASGATYRDVFSQRRLWEMGINRRDLPGYQPPASEDALFENIQEGSEKLERMEAEARLQDQLEDLNKQEEKLLKEQAEDAGEVQRKLPRRNQP